MSREDPKINLRVPQALKDKLQDAAILNGRSVNAEAVYRLETSFLHEMKTDDLLTPEEAKAIAKIARADLYSVLFNECVNKINASAKSGSEAASVDVPKILGDDYFNEESPLNKEVADPVAKALTNLGYVVEIDGSGFYIKF